MWPKVFTVTPNHLSSCCLDICSEVQKRQWATLEPSEAPDWPRGPCTPTPQLQVPSRPASQANVTLKRPWWHSVDFPKPWSLKKLNKWLLLCDDMGSMYKRVCCTAAIWGKALGQLPKLQVVTWNQPTHTGCSGCRVWRATCSIEQNKPVTSRQRTDNTFVTKDNTCAFKKKSEFWKTWINHHELGNFPLL